MPPPSATILITTRNRREELAGAVESALAQTAKCEVLVLDDGSTDGTAELVRDQFPGVRLYRFEESHGYIVRRNQGAELAAAPVLVSVDDDAIFPSRHTVEQTLAEFDDPRVGAVAIPFVNVRQDQAVRQLAPDGRQVYVTHAYIGTAHALRRDLFLRLGGYRPFLFHQGEEGDYCLRLLAAGAVVRLGRADPIHHFESPRRDFTRLDLYGRRNDVLFAWYNVPLPQMVVHLAGTVLNGLRHGLRCRRVGVMVRGLLMGFAACWQARADRRPIPRGVYRLSRLLKKRGAIPLAEVAAALPSPPALAAGWPAPVS